MPPLPTSSARRAVRSRWRSSHTLSTSRTVTVTAAAVLFWVWVWVWFSSVVCFCDEEKIPRGAAPEHTTSWSYLSVHVFTSLGLKPDRVCFASSSSWSLFPIFESSWSSRSRYSSFFKRSMATACARYTVRFSCPSAETGRSTTSKTSMFRVTFSTCCTLFTTSPIVTKITASSGRKRQSSSAQHVPATPAPTTTRTVRGGDGGNVVACASSSAVATLHRMSSSPSSSWSTTGSGPWTTVRPFGPPPCRAPRINPRARHTRHIPGARPRRNRRARLNYASFASHRC